jgi:hypothetical protein
VLGPFLLASAPVNEVEPNSELFDAQVIMRDTLINGVMDKEGAVDYLRFAGKHGDMVSFVATFERVLNRLD